MHGAQRKVMVAIVVAVAGLTIAACGSSSNSGSSGTAKTTTTGTTTTGTTTTASTAGAGGFAAQRTKLEACLKSHGITLPSRPAGGFRSRTTTTGTGTTPGGGYGAGRRFFGGGGGFAGNPKYAAAFKACGADFGGGRFAGGAGVARFSSTVLTKFVACVKQHGYTLPKPNTSGTGPTFPASIEKNKQFQTAAKSCESILRSGFHPPAGAAPPGQTTPTGTTTSST